MWKNNIGLLKPAASISNSCWIQNLQLICVIFLMLLLSPACTTKLYAEKQGIEFKHLSIEDGLINNTVYCIFQDHRGFMWFGTRSGLSKYDGYKFTHYYHDVHDSSSIADDGIYSIIEGKNGNLWIGTSGGLCLYNREQDCFTRYLYNPNGNGNVNDNGVWIVFEDSQENLWVGREVGGLDLLDKEKGAFTRYQHDPNNDQSLSGNNISTILEDRKGNLWIGTKTDGLNLFDREKGTFIHYKHDPGNRLSLSSNMVTTLYEDSKGNLWVGTSDRGVCLFDRNKNTFINFRQELEGSSLNNNNVRAIVEDENGIIWIGTDGGGINFFDIKQKTFTYTKYDPQNQNSLSSNVIFTIFKDDTDLMWVGSFQGGVNVYNKYRFSLYNKVSRDKNGLSYKSVTSIFQDTGDNIWLGTDGGGLNLFDRENETFVHYKSDPLNDNSLSGNAIMCIAEDHKGYLWIGTWGNGLNRYDKKNNKFIRYKHNPKDEHSIYSNNVMAVYEDSKKNLWIGMIDGGLGLFDRNKDAFVHYRHYSKKDVRIINNVITMLEDSKGNFWIGSMEGLFQFDRNKNTFVPWLHDPSDSHSISGNDIRAIFEDSSGNLWIGTEKGGLNLLTDIDTKSFIVYRQDNQLPNNKVNGILEDDHGNLWISANQGLSKFNPQTGNFRNYNVSDGLQSTDFNYTSSMKDRNGVMYFGGINGFNLFHPDSIKENICIAPVVITELSIMNKPVRIGEKINGNVILQKSISEIEGIELSYKDRVFSFEFAVLHYTLPEKNKYAYKMDGFEEEWNYIGNRHIATYTNLAQGKYTFKVKASNSDGVWNEEGTSIKITIIPPFWQTWWFKILSFFIVISVIVLLYKRKMRIVKRQKELLEKLVNLRTKELNEKKKQTDDILQNVKDGLFLIDKECLIESQYSASLEFILEKKELGGKNFIEFFNNKIKDKNLKTIKMYFSILFDDSVDEDSIFELNPLSQIEVPFEMEDMGVTTKHLTFNFKRVLENEIIHRVIVTVNDITDKILLEQDLEESKEENKRKMDWLLSILNVEPTMLRQFINSTTEEFENVDRALQSMKNKDKANELINSIYRSIHTIKGNASLLELDFIAEKAHIVENEIAELKKKKRISIKDVSNLFYQTQTVQEVHNEIKGFIDRIGQINQQFENKTGHDQKVLIKSLNKLINNLGNEYNKKINFVTTKYKNEIIPIEKRLIIKDILVQLIRNSMYHGIEDENDRTETGKAGSGTIEIENFKRKDKFVIKFKDDGRGLKLEALRQKAKSLGKWSAKEIDRWNDKKLAEVIFEPGLSTAENTDLTAGRGIGMDIIKSKVEGFSGKIQIETKENQYCIFTIEFPQ